MVERAHSVYLDLILFEFLLEETQSQLENLLSQR